MKKLINRKVYNTGTATIVADWSATSGEKETLMRSFRGDHFIVGSGGPLSRWKGETGIVAITIDAAKYWLSTKGFKYRTVKGVIRAEKK